MNGWWDFCQFKHPHLSKGDCSKVGASWGIRRHKHMLREFRRSHSMSCGNGMTSQCHVVAKNRGISMFQPSFSQSSVVPGFHVSQQDCKQKKLKAMWILHVLLFLFIPFAGKKNLPSQYGLLSTQLVSQQRANKEKKKPLQFHMVLLCPRCRKEH